MKRIHDIETEVFSAPYDIVLFWIYMDAVNAVFNVAECLGIVIGYYILLIEDGIGHLISIAIHRRYWGLGIGASLLDHAIRVARRRGVHGLFLEVRTSNTRAINLYMSRGFRIISRLPRYYGDEDAYEMHLPLDNM